MSRKKARFSSLSFASFRIVGKIRNPHRLNEVQLYPQYGCRDDDTSDIHVCFGHLYRFIRAPVQTSHASCTTVTP
jgi:hypothetical protein